jgi:FtsH-binding integral membrane protein
LQFVSLRISEILSATQGLMFTRAVAAVASVGSHLQPVSFLSFHIGSLYLAAHLRFAYHMFCRCHPHCHLCRPHAFFSVIEVAAVVELILFPMFMAFRVTLQPLPPPSPVNSAPSPSTPRAADAAAKQQ